MASFPTTPKFRAVDFRTVDPVLMTRSQNGKRYVRKVSGHRWEFTLSYPPLQKEEFKPVFGFVNKVKNAYTPFTIIPPNFATPSGTQIVDTTIAASASAGASSVSLSGATAGATFVAGDVVKFSGHDKVYVLTDNATADGSGNATININPVLVEDVTTDMTAKHSDVPFTVAIKNVPQEFSAGVTGLYSYELDVEEEL